MSELSPDVPEDAAAEDAATEGVIAQEDPDAEEYLPDEPGPVSSETGTVYDPDGEPAETPQDLVEDADTE